MIDIKKTEEEQVSCKSGKGGKRVIAAIVAVLVALLIITGISVAISTANIQREAKALNSNFSNLATHASLGNKEGALQYSANIKNNVDSISSELTSPTWIFLSYWPFIGDMVTKIQDLSQAGSLACSEVLEPYIQALPEQGLIDFKNLDKAISSHTLQNLITPLSNCQEGLEHLSISLNEIDDFSFMGTGTVYSTKTSTPVSSENAEETTTQTINLSVNDIFNCAKWAVNTCALISKDSQKYADMLPDLLGENGKRTYLLLAQQNAEVRSTGGFWGSAGIITVENSKIKLGKFVSGAHYANYPEPDKNIPETEEEKELFGSRICFIPADVNFVADFPSAVKRYKEMWVNAGQKDVDGVIALDPVFLEDILSLTGGITTKENIVVDGTNAARLLEHDVYYNFSVKEQDKFFADVAKGAFNKLTSSMSSIDPLCACNVLRNSFDDRRLQIWMQNEGEEQLMQLLGCSGALSKNDTTSALSANALTPNASSSNTLGVYFNNSSYSKLSWWLKTDTQILSSSKNADGSYNYQVKTVMANTLTKKEEQELPTYVAASNKTGACPNKGSMCVWTYMYAPYAGTITNMHTNARICSQEIIDSEVVAGKVDGTMRCGTWNDFEVYYAPVQLEPGEVASFTYTVTTSAPNTVAAESSEAAEGTESSGAAEGVPSIESMANTKLEIDTTPLGQR